MAVLTTPTISPFHEGERLAQARMGLRNAGAWAPRSIRPFMPDQHREFFAAQPFLAAAARDKSGQPWATLLAGRAGFVGAPDPTTLTIDARPDADDALADAFATGADIGLLGLEFATRRRNRVNGRIAAADGGGFRLAVRQSFGNCPQHIRPRDWRRADTPGAAAPVRRGAALTAAEQATIAAADTFFIASGHMGGDDLPSDGLDVSHRGGAQGFVKVESATRLAFADLGGNRFYNTVGNLMLDARVGLLFVDFTTGDLLQIAGRATIAWSGPEVAAVERAERLVTIDIASIVHLPGRLPLRWDDVATMTAADRL